MGCLWLRFYEMNGNSLYHAAARRSIQFVARTQNLKSSHLETRGAIAGSYPIFGWYERFAYPNWAAKFFVDALLRLHQVDRASIPLAFKG
jgi:hypothetical protein